MTDILEIRDRLYEFVQATKDKPKEDYSVAELAFVSHALGVRVKVELVPINPAPQQSLVKVQLDV